MQRLDVSAARQIALLNLGLWTVAFAMFMGPAAVNDRADARMLTYTFGTVFAGMLCCFGLFLLISRFRTMSKWRLIALIAAALFATVSLHAYVDALWTTEIYHATFPDSGRPMHVGYMTFTNALSLGPIYVIYASGVALTFSSFALRDRERSLAAAREMAQEAQLAALRFQINPHFLFNTLNAVTTLIGSGRNAEAEAVVVRLSDFFRASLAAPTGALTPLSEEFDLVGSYLDIEAARFGPRLVFDIDCPETLRSALVPHFLLQPLVENAVKHGVAPTKRPVTITLRAFMRNEALVLRVVDNGDPSADAREHILLAGTGVGLNNVSGRLAAMFGNAGKLTTTSDERGFVAQIEMPLQTEATWKAAA